MMKMEQFTVRTQTVVLMTLPSTLIVSFLSFFTGLIVYVWNMHPIAGYCVLGFVLVFGYGPQGWVATLVVLKWGWNMAKSVKRLTNQTRS
jgi:hypothetical protein